MNWKSFILGAAAGVAGGYVLKEVLSKTVSVSPETVLEDVKTAFKKQGPISGSWILMKAEPFEKEMFHYNVYKGGITKQVNGVNEQYEFVADAHTGAILDVAPTGGNAASL